VNTRDTAVRVRGVPRCVEIQYRTRTRATRFGSTAGLPVPVFNPNDSNTGNRGALLSNDILLLLPCACNEIKRHKGQHVEENPIERWSLPAPHSQPRLCRKMALY
jgi:hypothetical protein